MGNCTSTTSVHIHHPLGPLEIYNGNGEAGYFGYSLRLINDTNVNYFFAVYQDSPGLQSVAWQVRQLPARRSVPTTNDVFWTMSYGISIANWDVNQQKEFTTSEQQQYVKLGNSYEVISEDEFPSINPKSIGKTAEMDQILFKNNTSYPSAMNLDMGFTVAGKVVAVQPKAIPGEAILFNASPSYYVALYRKIKPGQLVADAVGVVAGPISVTFTDGVASKSVVAYTNGGEIRLTATDH